MPDMDINALQARIRELEDSLELAKSGSFMAAHAFGWLPPLDAEKLRAERDALAARVKELEAKRETEYGNFEHADAHGRLQALVDDDGLIDQHLLIHAPVNPYRENPEVAS